MIRLAWLCALALLLPVSPGAARILTGKAFEAPRGTGDRFALVLAKVWQEGRSLGYAKSSDPDSISLSAWRVVDFYDVRTLSGPGVPDRLRLKMAYDASMGRGHRVYLLVRLRNDRPVAFRELTYVGSGRDDRALCLYSDDLADAGVVPPPGSWKEDNRTCVYRDR